MLVYILIIHCLWPSHTIKSAVTYVSFLTKQIIYGTKNIKLLDIYKHINKKQHQMYPRKGKKKNFFFKNACLCIVLTMDWWTMKPSVITQYTHIYRSPTGFRGNSWSPSQAKWWTQQKNSKEYCRLMVVSLKFDVPVIKRDNISKTPIWFN